SPPVVALLAMADEQMTANAITLGAMACYSLDTPLDWLRSTIVALVGDRIEKNRARAFGHGDSVLPSWESKH
ncbi:MAG: hypothetical protein V2A73_23230, partial [Pseudomonadota bacterium]